LKFPDWEAPQTPGDFTAIEMFIQSAQRVKPDFDPDIEDMIYLTRVCRLVGGMPLGLELAASWIDVMSLRDIALEIQKSLDFLETDVRNIPDRHRSMRAVFDSSWSRLSESERQIFPRLSIFRGEFSRSAAEKVALASLRTLANLANKSLLKFDPDSNRYQIHELLRQYGTEKLRDFPQDQIETRQRHSIFFCEEVNNIMDLYKTGKSQLAIDRIEKDLTNILLAWDWAVDHSEYQQIDQAIDGICLSILR